MTAESSVATKLNSASVATTNVDMFVGADKTRIPSPEPDAVVYVFGNGGAAPEPYIGTSKKSVYRQKVSIIVRGAPQDYATAKTRALLVITTLHLATLSGYVSCLSQDSEPTWLGYDNNSRPGFAVNVVLTSEA